MIEYGIMREYLLVRNFNILKNFLKVVGNFLGIFSKNVKVIGFVFRKVYFG